LTGPWGNLGRNGEEKMNGGVIGKLLFWATISTDYTVER